MESVETIFLQFENYPRLSATRDHPESWREKMSYELKITHDTHEHIRERWRLSEPGPRWACAASISAHRTPPATVT